MHLPRSFKAGLLAAVMACTAAPFAQLPATAAQPPSTTHVDVKPVDHVTSVWGSFPGGANIDVWTEVRAGGSWSVSQRGQASGTGFYTLPLTYGQSSAGTYEYRVGGRHADGTVVYSDPFTLTRAGRPTATSAGSKTVTHGANVWGYVSHAPGAETWTEVKVGSNWSRSQTTNAGSSGYYALPLTYNSGTPGDTEFRVAVRYSDGAVSRSNSFTFTRLPRPTATTAGTKQVNETTYVWGDFEDRESIDVWTEVETSSGWSVSRRATANSDGSYALPLTYGADTPGTYTYRVAGLHEDGHVARSPEVTIKREAPPQPVRSTPTTTSGSKYDWMRAAGIPESQWQYADYIVSRESSWNPKAVNPYSGACGLAQAYPCSKLGSNWSDPVVALKWQYNYVTERYGGYQQAYYFWVRNRWY